MLELTAALLVFVSVVAAVFGLLRLSNARGVVDRRFALMAARKLPAHVDDVENPDLIRHSVSSMGPLRRLLGGGFGASTTRTLERAGMRLNVSEYMMVRVLVGILAFGFFVLVFQASAVGLIFGLAAAFIGFMVPALYVGARTGRRQRLISHQLLEALQLIGNAMRSGVAFLQAVKLAAAQVPSPMADELNQFLTDTTLGAPTEDALRSLADRCGTQDMELVVTTIIIQRTTGGRLAEVLDRIADTMREREQLRGEVRAMTGQQRLSGNIMAVYPFALGGLFTLMAPSIMKVLWQETAGVVLLVTAIVLQVVAIFWMRLVLRLDA